jgi:LPS-assembly lipoprotein
MSWRTRPISRAAPVVAAALAAAGALGGCGFTPLYGAPGVASDLSSIKVNVPHGRTAFLLGEDLDDAFGRDRDTSAAYRLDLSLIERRYPRGRRLDNTADSYESHLTVNYQLVEIDNGKLVLSGSVPVEVSYAASDQPYAGITAEQDAQKREADEAAQRIQIAIGAYFHRVAER